MLCILLFIHTAVELYKSLTVTLVYPEDGIVKGMEDYTFKKKANNILRKTESLTQLCKFTKTSMNRVCDSRGMVCSRQDINGETSCCVVKALSATKQLHMCDGCQSGCCRDYESCVSCCLHPDNVAYHSLRTYSTYQLGIPGDILETLSEDDFDWCEYVCRTSSRSVLPSENTYRSGYYRNCYDLESRPPIDQASANSDRSTACVRPEYIAESAEHDKFPSEFLCMDDEVYPLMKKPPSRSRVLRDYG